MYAEKDGHIAYRGNPNHMHDKTNVNIIIASLTPIPHRLSILQSSTFVSIEHFREKFQSQMSDPIEFGSPVFSGKLDQFYVTNVLIQYLDHAIKRHVVRYRLPNSRRTAAIFWPSTVRF
jgi:hypothetical protein